MPADTIWAALLSACAGSLSVIRGALADGIGLPGRALTPVAALFQSQSQTGGLNPAVAAIATGDAFPNLLLLISIGLVAFCEQTLLQIGSGRRRGFLEQSSLLLISFAKNAARELFCADAALQCVCVAAASAGRSHELHLLLQLYPVQRTLLSALCIPSFAIPVYHSDLPAAVGWLLQVVFIFLKSFSLLRIAQTLEGSSAAHMAGCVIALAAAFATRSILKVTLLPFIEPASSQSVRRRIKSASAVSFCCALSVYNGRVMLLDAIAVFFLIETLSPWSVAIFTTHRILQPAFEFVRSAFAWLYVSAWPAIKPHLQRCVSAVVTFLCSLSQPFAVLLRWLIAPLWRVASPLVIPSLTAYVAFHRAADVARDPSPLRLLTDGMVASAALLCSVVLYAHAVSRIFRCVVDPFRVEFLRWLGCKWCDCMLFPIELVPRLLRLLWRRVVLPALRVLSPVVQIILEAAIAAVKAALDAIQAAPVLGMISIILINIALLYLCYTNAVMVSILSAVGVVFSTAYSAAARVIAAPFSLLVRASTSGSTIDSKDTFLAMAIVALVQLSSCFYIRRALRSCRPLPSLAASAASPQQQQMTPQELQTLAESMSQPRQCPQCAFGPVDHFGCSDLRAHHGEVRPGASGVRTSNACPSCGFFGQSSEDWAAWQPRTESAKAFRRLRAWNEVVIIVRASVKSVIVPLLFMRVCSVYSVNPSAAAAVVMAYSAAAITENWRFFGSLTRSQLAPPPQRPDDSCGRANPPSSDNIPALSLEQAMASIESAAPDRVFLVKGSECCVCLDAFGTAAEDIVAAGGSGQHVAKLLRAMVPPVTPLR